MNELPTLVATTEHTSNILGMADVINFSDENTDQILQNLIKSISQGMEYGFPIILTTTPFFAKYAQDILPGNRIVASQFNIDEGPRPLSLMGKNFAKHIATGVEACPDSNGWIAFSINKETKTLDLLKEVAHFLKKSPIVCASNQATHLSVIGFSPELFSELIKINTNNELVKLISKYPSKIIETQSQTISKHK